MRSTLSRALFLATFAILSGQGCSLRSAPLWENFSREQAFAHVQHLVDLGPRPAGSEALEKSRLYIIESRFLQRFRTGGSGTEINEMLDVGKGLLARKI